MLETFTTCFYSSYTSIGHHHQPYLLPFQAVPSFQERKSFHISNYRRCEDFERMFNVSVSEKSKVNQSILFLPFLHYISEHY